MGRLSTDTAAIMAMLGVGALVVSCFSWKLSVAVFVLVLFVPYVMDRVEGRR